MQNPGQTYIENHGRQRLLVAGLSGLALFMSFAPREERALFVLPGLPVKAFGAIVPVDESRTLSPDDLYSLVSGPVTRAFFARTPQRPVGPGTGSPFSDTVGSPGAAPAGLTPTPPAGAPDGTLPVPGGPALAGTGPGAGPGGNVPGPALASTGPSAGPGAPFPFAGSPGLPGTSPVGPVLSSTTPPTTLPGAGVPAVPEPATWALMIVGFTLTGTMLRRKRAPLARSARREA